MGRENAQLWLLLLFPPQKEPHFAWQKQIPAGRGSSRGRAHRTGAAAPNRGARGTAGLSGTAELGGERVLCR